MSSALPSQPAPDHTDRPPSDHSPSATRIANSVHWYSVSHWLTPSDDKMSPAHCDGDLADFQLLFTSYVAPSCPLFAGIWPSQAEDGTSTAP